MNKKLLILTIFLSLSGYFAFTYAQNFPTQIEVVYPTLVPGMPPPQSIRTFLPSYIRYIYSFAIFSGGLLSLLALIWGGFRFLMSAGNPGMMADAREQMLAGILGLLVIFGSYVFLNEINPEITQLNLPNIQPARKGIIIYNDGNCGEGRGNGLPELADLPENIHYLALSETKGNLTDPRRPAGGGYDIRSIFSFHSGHQLSVFFYQSRDCSGTPVDVGNFQLRADECITLPSPAQNIHCIRLIWRLPGVWLFTYPWGNPLDPGHDFANDRLGLPYAHYQVSDDALDPPLNNNVQSIALVAPRDETGEIKERYGVILHNNAGGLMSNKGWSEVYLPDSGSNVDITVYNLEGEHQRASSITVFSLPEETPSTSPVILCRNPRCDPEWDNENERYVYPQLSVWWGNANLQLNDITAESCSQRDNGRSIDSSNIGNALTSPENWGNISCGEFRQIIGGVKVGGEGHHWRDAQTGDEIDMPGVREIPNAKRENGTSSVYLPEEEALLALLFYDRERVDPIDLVINSAGEWKSAAVINGSVSDLSTLRWNDKVSTLIVVRILRLQ